MPVAYAYMRWSTKGQGAGDKDSRTRQIEGFEKFKKDFPDVEIKQIYVDEGISGHSGQNLINGELSKILEAVENGSIRPNDYIVCESIDRLTRQGWETATDLIRGFIKKGINLYTVFDSRLYTSRRLEDFLMIGLIAERAKDESDTKSIRVKEAWKRRIDKEKTIFKNKAPLGLKIVDGRYEINEHEQKEIVELLELIAKSGVNKAISIVNKYSEYRWNKAKVHALMTKQWVIGTHSKMANVYTNKEENNKIIRRTRKQVIEEKIENFYPKIVSEAVFYRAVKAMKDRSFQKDGGRSSTEFNNIFNKMIFCDFCWEPLFYQQAKNPSKSKNNFIRIFHCPTCKWQMPFDVVFYEFLDFLVISGLGAGPDTGIHMNGVGGKITTKLYDAKKINVVDIEKLESNLYKAVEDEKNLNKQIDELDIFPIPNILINKIKQVEDRVKEARNLFEEALEKKNRNEMEVDINDVVTKMETEKGRIELNYIFKNLGILMYFQLDLINKKEGKGYNRFVTKEEGEFLFGREFDCKKTNSGSRAKDKIEKYGFDIIDVIEGREYKIETDLSKDVTIIHM